MRSSVLLATFLLTIAALAAERWTLPDHFYSIAPPAGWAIGKTRLVFTEGSGSYRPTERLNSHFPRSTILSAFQGICPTRHWNTLFPEERVARSIQRVHGEGGMGSDAGTRTQIRALVGWPSWHAGVLR
jgi:hypothetical protein